MTMAGVVMTPSETVNAIVALLVMVLVVGFIYGVILWKSEGRIDKQDDRIDAQDDRIAELEELNDLLAGRIQALAEYLGVEIHDPVPDGPDDPPYEPELSTTDPISSSLVVDPDPITAPIEAVPPTVPDGMPLAVQTALIEREFMGQTFRFRTDGAAVR